MKTRRRLPVVYAVAGVIPPFGLVVASFVPTWYVAMALAHALNIPDDVPVKDQPFGLLWLILQLVTMTTFACVGFVLGLLLNAVILRFVFGWSWLTAVQEVGLDTAPWIPRSWVVKPLSDFEDHDSEEDPMYDPLLDDPLWP